MNAFKLVSSAALLGLLVACSGGADDPPSTSSSSSGGSASRSPSGGGGGDSPTQESNPTESGASSKPRGATNVTCSTADDCGNWFCDCADANGDTSPVNASDCRNGYCMDAATSCPDACSAFGKTWTGSAGGGPDQK